MSNQLKNHKVIIVMPAYNAEKTLQQSLNDIPEGSYDEVILVDDASTDGTAALAKKLGLTVVEHAKNLGYGGNQKTCYKTALEHGADIVVMLHPDNQYDAKLVPYMAAFIAEGVCDVMLGTRIRTRREAMKGGMPVYKYFMNRLLTLIEGSVLGIVLAEMHSGYRSYSRRVLLETPFEANSNDFVFDQQFLAQMAFFNFSVGDIPVPTRYFEEASSIGFFRSVVYGFGTLWTMFIFVLNRIGILRSAMFKRKKGE